MTNLVPHRCQPDLFIADLTSVAFKELAEHLEFPFFGLSPQPYNGVRRFEDDRRPDEDGGMQPLSSRIRSFGK